MSEPKYITDYLKVAAAKLSDKPFLICPDKTLSWTDAYAGSDKVTSVLGDRFKTQQKIIGLLLPDSWQFVLAYFGIVGAGHIAMPLDITFKKLEFDFVTKAVKPDLIIVNRQTRHLISGPSILIEDILLSDMDSIVIDYKLPPDKQIATLFFSSGTTGKPKPIPNTHTNQIWDIAAIAEPMGWSDKDSLLINLHLAHRHGLVICLLGAVYHGNTVYLEERFDSQKTLEKLASGQITLYSTVPAAYAQLIQHNPPKKYDMSAVRLFASSSSALSPQLQKLFYERFGHTILDRYGTSETGSIAVKKDASDDSFSDLLEDVAVRIEKGGEVAIKSPGLFPGYYKNPAATAANSTIDGWWLTGDIGEMNAGKLTLKGRTKEKISKDGYSIFPQDIEWSLLQNPDIDEVKVLGLSGEADNINRDDKIVAFFTGSNSIDKLTSYSGLNLPRSWRPDVYIKLEKIPKTPNGKPRLAELKKIAEQSI